jgi:hypothetical protein
MKGILQSDELMVKYDFSASWLFERARRFQVADKPSRNPVL